MNDAIVIERLTKHYDSRRVVDGVELRVPEGCVYGLMGRNGAGKSTLIKMLLGMVQPDAGRATLLGVDSRELDPVTRARIASAARIGGHTQVRPRRRCVRLRHAHAARRRRTIRLRKAA